MHADGVAGLRALDIERAREWVADAGERRTLVISPARIDRA